MRVFEVSARVDLTALQMEKLRRLLLEKTPIALMPHELAQRTGLNRLEARAIVLALEAASFGELYVNVYHDCEEHPAYELAYRTETLPTNWECPECEQVTKPHELSFEISIHIHEPLEVE